MTVDTFLAWSGWTFGLAGFAASLITVAKALRETRRSRVMADVLSERTLDVQPPATRTVAPSTDQRIRSLLVHAAAGGQPLSVAIPRARRMHVDAESVTAMAEHLVVTGLLEHDGALGPDTVLRLRR
jgi:hypothetical protein